MSAPCQPCHYPTSTVSTLPTKHITSSLRSQLLLFFSISTVKFLQSLSESYQHCLTHTSTQNPALLLHKHCQSYYVTVWQNVTRQACAGNPQKKYCNVCNLQKMKKTNYRRKRCTLQSCCLIKCKLKHSTRGADVFWWASKGQFCMKWAQIERSNLCGHFIT